MAANWTDDQLKAIELKNRNILVAAAAGSGKTAVLVERIIRKITDSKAPEDIDRLLVVTFTNAAAAQMKERIGVALEARLDEEPENVHLQRQLTLLNHAKIMTIHSFCLYVVRNYFDRLDIDPDFRIADEGETKLLKADILKALIEENFEMAQPGFIKFVESYATGKKDEVIEKYIDELYRFAEGYPFPEEQLNAWHDELSKTNPDELDDTEWIHALMADVKLQADELLKTYNALKHICEEPGGPYFYSDMITSDKMWVSRLVLADRFEDINDTLSKMEFVRKPAKKKIDCDISMKEYVSDMRDYCRDVLKDMQKRYIVRDIAVLSEQLKRQEEPLKALLCLAKDYGRRYREAKKEKNILDFGDLEHYALDILVEDRNGAYIPTDIADSISTMFDEILIDEYQDSNRVQELILRSVSRERFGKPDIFMVGDVKQSIYKFRLARPELFLEKYNSYTEDDSQHQKIDLHMNFRSRSEVLASINYIFSQIMTKKLGNIIYDEAAKLNAGADYPDSLSECDTELLIVDTSKDSMEVIGEDNDYQKREIEALAVAKRIKELTDRESGYKVYDRDTDTFRTAEYRDIVILLRSFSGWSDIFVSVLSDAGIPAFAESQTGYFDALEIRTVMDLLSIIDNPVQDIPLAAVLKSPIGKVTNSELALISAAYKRYIFENAESRGQGLYDACMHYIDNSENVQLAEKLKSFFEMRDRFEKMALYMNLDELLRVILDETGYGSVASVMPGGKVREANLNMLVAKAAEFEKTSYHGLFNFVKYIENIKKYSVDLGEASVIGENDNIVRLTTIHKSKGLEYPIVIISGMGKKFNMQDSNSRILFDPDLGIASDSVNLENRTKSATLVKKTVQRRMVLSSMGEELRVLYVAMTRAKEKLIMTGCDSNPEKLVDKYKVIAGLRDTEIPYTYLSKARSYMDWVLMALMRHKAVQSLSQLYGIDISCNNRIYDPEAGFRIMVIMPCTLIDGLALNNIVSYRDKDKLENWNDKICYDEKAAKEIEERLAYTYHRQSELNMHTKVSVSELKLKSMDIDEAETAGWVTEDNVVRIPDNNGKLRQLPKFMQSDDTKISGAERGTAMHRMMELIDFKKASEQKDLLRYIGQAKEEFTGSGKLAREQYECVDDRKIAAFFATELADRMTRADFSGKLFKEKQFVMGVRADEIGGDYHGDELILIQGIVDAYFEEDGEIVIVDYKNDNVKTAEELIKNYKTQLDYYSKTLCQVTGKRVKEKIIYSFKLRKEIKII